MLKIHEIFFESIPSTSTYAKENAHLLTMPSLIVANHQSAGRGRRGNTFYSPADTGLYMTVIFEAPRDCSLVTPAAAVAVCRCLKKYGIDPKIKWVNDVFVGGFKVCGILSEMIDRENKNYVSVGIGINLTTTEFPDELNMAGSVGIKCDKLILAKEIAQTLLSLFETDNNKIISEYRELLFIIGKEIRYSKNNKEYYAVVADINNQCNLVVIKNDGSEDTLSSGEISIKL